MRNLMLRDTVDCLFIVQNVSYGFCFFLSLSESAIRERKRGKRTAKPEDSAQKQSTEKIPQTTADADHSVENVCIVFVLCLYLTSFILLFYKIFVSFICRNVVDAAINQYALCSFSWVHQKPRESIIAMGSSSVPSCFMGLHMGFLQRDQLVCCDCCMKYV